MTMASKNQTYYKNPFFVARKIGSMRILISTLDPRKIFQIDEIGFRIWSLINGKRDFNKIVKSTLYSKKTLDSSRALKKSKAAILKFIKDIQKIGAISSTK